MNTLVISEFAIAHIAMILDDFVSMLRRQILREMSVREEIHKNRTNLLPHINVPSFSFLSIALLLYLNPFL